MNNDIIQVNVRPTHGTLLIAAADTHGGGVRRERGKMSTRKEEEGKRRGKWIETGRKKGEAEGKQGGGGG